MNGKERVYIIGHKNPDIDSICSAYAYAILKNKIDPEKEYIAVRAGHLSSTASGIIDELNIECPPYMRDIFPKVSDVCLYTDERVQASSPLSILAKNYNESNPSVIPIFEGDEFYGLLSVDDIATWVMHELSDKKKINSVPTIRDIMNTKELSVSSDELFTEAAHLLSTTKKRGIVVKDDNGYVGYATRRCFLKTPRHNVILVDHNEPKQSIRGIETANIIEIIDHHRLDAVKTDLPIFIDAEPLGSTCTIVHRQFLLHGIMPDALTARVLLTGIIADTLILRSPTTTTTDVKSANELAMLCNENIQEFGRKMFSNVSGLKSREPEEAIMSDFKSYNEKGVKFGIGQCEVTTLKDLDDYSAIYLNKLEDIRSKSDLDWAVLMVTDVLREQSILLCTDYHVNNHLQYAAIDNLIYDMPGVLSRKKQLLPEILSAIEM